MKKAFCFDYFSMSQSKSKFFHVWFEFFPSYLSRKKEISETFLGLGLRPRPQKTFPRFPFFYFGNLGKTQIRRGKILLQTWHGKKSKQNTICQANIKFLTILCKINETAHIFGVILIDISLKNLSCYMRCKSF